MTIRTRAQLKSDAASSLPDNTAAEISPADVRGQFDNVADSAVMPEDLNSKHTIWVPAGAMTPKVTNGAAEGTYDSGLNDVTLRTLAFDTTTQEYAQFCIGMPKGWDEGTVTFIPYWTNAGGSSTQTVRWTLAGLAVSNDDTLNGTFGTAQNSDDTWLAQNDLHIGPESSAITIGGTPAESDLVVFQVSRDVANDNMSGDALLIGIKLLITYAAVNDA